MVSEGAIVAASYALGALNGAYYLVRGRTGRDIRTMGSGTAGARNAARVLGRPWFAAVFGWDALKGAAAVALAAAAGADPGVAGAAAVAVVAGHVWPPQLGFRGGKGMATSFGALLVLGYPLVAGPVLVVIPAYALVRQATMAGLVAFAASPLVALGWRGWGAEAAATTLLVALVLFAHRDNLAEYARGRRRRATAAGPAASR